MTSDAAEVWVPAALSQLLSVGFVWIFFHCAGMCGPIVGGLQLGGPLGLALYQAGRVITLGTLGALAGLVGARASDIIEGGGPFVALVAALATALYAVRSGGAAAAPTLLHIGSRSGARARITAAWQRRWQRTLGVLFLLGALRPLAVGMALGFLPCMIVVWSLSLAASSGSPATGALVMGTLVLMTTPTLALATLLPRLLSRVVPPRLLSRVASAMLLVSSLWLLFVGLAGLGVLDHQHIRVTMDARSVMIMLW